MPTEKPRVNTANITAKKKPKAEAFEKRKWKKGQSGNPLGAAIHSPELRKVRQLTKAELAEVGNLVLKNDYDAILELNESPTASVLQRMLAAIAIKVIEKGDMSAFDILLNRMIGKVKDEVNLTHNLPQVTVLIPSNGREAKEVEVERKQKKLPGL